ncbi:glycine cleavage system aminomethyltransferase GcvT [Desulfolutivibrio sp.]|uniref:glycine cleavage system aminomethyltransferase GcvT n=1 Tax=Desulfolutivibrio sp. TaxID=2773296 RepID=UPI002F969D47
MENLSTTPLTAHHQGLGAKIVPFAGFAMPVQYTSILAEHAHTRTKASIFDICHMGEFTVQGPGAAQALGRCVTQDVETLGVNKCRYGFLLNDAGGIIDDLIVYRLEDERFMVVVNASRIAPDFARLRALMPEAILLEDISAQTAKIDLQGPHSFAVLSRLLPGDWSQLKYFNCTWVTFEKLPLLVSRTGYTGELGYEFFLPAYKALALWEKLLADPDVKPAGLGARDTLRLEMGYPLYGQDLDEEHTPSEAGYASLLKPGAFMGSAGAGLVRERLIALAVPGRRSARHNDLVLCDDAQAGRVTSGSFSPSLGHGIALAYVAMDDAEKTDFTVKAAKTKLAAVRTELPFYKEGTARKKLA